MWMKLSKWGGSFPRIDRSLLRRLRAPSSLRGVNDYKILIFLRGSGGERHVMERRSLDHLRELPRAGSIGTFMIIPWVLLAHSGRRQAPSHVCRSLVMEEVKHERPTDTKRAWDGNGRLWSLPWFRVSFAPSTYSQRATGDRVSRTNDREERGTPRVNHKGKVVSS